MYWVHYKSEIYNINVAFITVPILPYVMKSLYEIVDAHYFSGSILKVKFTYEISVERTLVVDDLSSSLWLKNVTFCVCWESDTIIINKRESKMFS